MCQVIPLVKAFLNNLFILANNMRPGQIWRLNTAACTDLAWWQAMLDNWPGTSIHQFLFLQEPAHHLFTDASGLMGLQSLLPTSLATICMAKGQPPYLHCTQGSLPHRTCLCCMGTPVVRVLGPLPLKQHGSSVPSQLAPRSGPDCIPPFAMLGTLHGTV